MKVYYCRAMDGVDRDVISNEYNLIHKLLNEKGHDLVNDFNESSFEMLPITWENSEKVVKNNISDLKKADIVIINISIPNHSYIGCIGEMIYAKQMGIKVITIVGESGNDKHFWTLYHSDIFVNNLQDAVNIL